MKPPKRGTKAWSGLYKQVLVGWHSASQTVKTIYVQNDGTMSNGNRTHFPVGRTAEHEALVVFGLSKVQSFPMAMAGSIQAYQEELRKQNSDKGPDASDLS